MNIASLVMLAALWAIIAFFGIRSVVLSGVRSGFRASLIAFSIIALAIVVARRPLLDTMEHISSPSLFHVYQSETTTKVNVSRTCANLKSVQTAGGGVGYLDAIRRAGPRTEVVLRRIETGRNAKFVALGWAATSDEQPANAVCVVVDDRVDHDATEFTGIARPDVVTATNKAALFGAGFRATFSLRAYPPGLHQIRAVATSSVGELWNLDGRWQITTK